MVSMESIEQRLLFIALLFVIGGSVAANLFSWDVKWQVPLIYAVLYVLLSVVLEVRNHQVPPTATHYRNGDDFFASFTHLIRTAERRVYTTYMRNMPPTQFHVSPVGQQYFTDSIAWMRRNPGCSFHRIIGMPTQEPDLSHMREWLSSHYQEMQNLPNYHARIVNIDSGVDGISISIIDNKAVFILLSNDGSFMSGHSLETPEAISSFRDYYSSWWALAEPLESYARRTNLVGMG